MTLPPIAVETTNIPTTISCSLHNRHYFFIYSRVITSVFIIRGCYVPFQFALLTALYFFYENYENDLLGNTPLSENDPSKPIKILKMTPQKNAPLPPLPLTYKGSASYCPPTWYSRVLLIQVYTGKIRQSSLVFSCCGFAFISVLELVERF